MTIRRKLTIGTATAEIRPKCQPPPAQADERAVPTSWERYLAHAISLAGSPPVLAPITIALTASTLSDPQAWAWAGVYTLLAILLPFLHLLWLLRQGIVTDLDVQQREQRIRPLAFTILCAGLAWLALIIGSAPARLIAVTGALSLKTAIILATTLYWKISVHGAAAAGVGVVMWAVWGTPWPLLIGVPMIAWSRIRLQRHTVLQTVVGALLGLITFLLALPLAR